MSIGAVRRKMTVLDAGDVMLVKVYLWEGIVCPPPGAQQRGGQGGNIQ
jgi:hypothetical protein